MGLSNSAKRSRFYTSTINQNQGGGNTKAGLYSNVNINSSVRIAYLNRSIPKSAAFMRINQFPKANESRNIGPNKNYGSKSLFSRMNW
jgi:hypothetical protein